MMHPILFSVNPRAAAETAADRIVEAYMNIVERDRDRLLAAAKLAYGEAMHPGSAVALALLKAIRAVEPDFPARVRVR